jgi:hypothetical protein
MSRVRVNRLAGQKSCPALERRGFPPHRFRIPQRKNHRVRKRRPDCQEGQGSILLTWPIQKKRMGRVQRRSCQDHDPPTRRTGRCQSRQLEARRTMAQGTVPTPRPAIRGKRNPQEAQSAEMETCMAPCMNKRLLANSRLPLIQKERKGVRGRNAASKTRRTTDRMNRIHRISCFVISGLTRIPSW